MTPEAGTLACTVRWADGPEQEKTEGFRLAGGLIVHVEAERCRIAPEDVRSLIFAGRPVPVVRERVRHERGVPIGAITIEGHAAVNPAGRAVVIHLRAGSWIVPLVSFRRVARGEAASAPLFPLIGVNLYE
jgi:hypothetical protein